MSRVASFIRAKARNLHHRLRSTTFQPYQIRRQVAGESIDFVIGDLFGEGLYGPQHDLWPEFDWIRANGIREGDAIIDCGANHGFSTVLFAKWAGDKGRVFAVEPLPHNMEILKQNLALSGRSNVSCHNVAAGARRELVQITTHPNGTIQRRASIQRTIMVPVERLDKIAKGTRIDFLKIDVEGFELDVLRGSERILTYRPRLDLELHVFLYHDRIATLHSILSLLDLDCYQVYLQLEIDGVIKPYQKDEHSAEQLSQHDLIHLFCK